MEWRFYVILDRTDIELRIGRPISFWEKIRLRHWSSRETSVCIFVRINTLWLVIRRRSKNLRYLIYVVVTERSELLFSLCSRRVPGQYIWQNIVIVNEYRMTDNHNEDLVEDVLSMKISTITEEYHVSNYLVTHCPFYDCAREFLQPCQCHCLLFGRTARHCTNYCFHQIFRSRRRKS